MNFDFKENYILENEAVRLEPLKYSDYDVLLNYSENEPEIWEFNAGGANGKDNLEKYIANALLQREQEKEYAFIIFDKKTQNYVGSTRFMGYFWITKPSKSDIPGMAKHIREAESIKTANTCY